MKNIIALLHKDQYRVCGLIFILISLSLFLTCCYFTEASFVFFICCYVFTAVYSVMILRRPKGTRLPYTIYALILWFISAFALNREMLLFQNSTNWLCTYLIISCLALIGYTFLELLPLYLKHVLTFFLGSALPLFLYYATYLFPMYAISIPAAIFLGISIHTFIPLFLFIISLISLTRILRKYPVLKYAVIPGMLLPILISICFIAEWKILYQKTSEDLKPAHINNNLPSWVQIAQQLPANSITEKFLKSELVYDIPNPDANWFWSKGGGGNWSESRKHDPLVEMAVLLAGRPPMHDIEKINILKSTFNSRHLAQDRLWSGDDLETTHLVNHIRIYPEYRIAYTEQTITIKNTTKDNWNNNQEAIYTFHMPEGSVVTSLSLWINDREEKAHLGTKGKAESAYKSIVGTENRDPSVVHWQEGNTVSVRVFPCTNKEDRKFKIGITSPLKTENGQSTYENTYFDGPASGKTKEQLNISFSRPTKTSGPYLDLKANEAYTETRTYQNQWSLNFPVVPLSNTGFTFAGATYKLRAESPVTHSFSPVNIYLDLNASWTEPEFMEIWEQVKHHSVYVFNGKLTPLNEKNLHQVYDTLNSLQFSIFPFYEIISPEMALVISKSRENTPNLSELAEDNGPSLFQQKLKMYLSTAKPIHIFHIGKMASPYLKTLKEFGVFYKQEGTLEQLGRQLKTQRFTSFKKEEDIVTIPEAGMSIYKIPEVGTHKAPDHLLRLFAYHEILRQTGATYFQENQYKPDLTKLANEAFIVSPVSSLIVLESQEDYKRFDLPENTGSLKNASMNGSGEAPEPHEWMLIFLLVSVIGYGYYTSRSSKKFGLSWK